MYELTIYDKAKQKKIFFGQYVSLDMMITHMIKYVVPMYTLMIQNEDGDV